MVDLYLLRRAFLRSPICTAAAALKASRICISVVHEKRPHYTTASQSVREERESKNENENKGKWFTLPPFTSTVDASSLGKELSGRRMSGIGSKMANGYASISALKWVVRCCPQLPRSLVQKLFRLRQVRRESPNTTSESDGSCQQKRRVTRVAAKESMNLGDRIFLPITVQQFPSQKHECHCNEEETGFIRNLELYKDSAIIVVNKPPGLSVQGGIGIQKSLDELAATCLRYDYSEPPRLVHRLDRDSSGILVMGRTQTSSTVLHSIFREKTFGANEDIGSKKRILERRYLALVIGSPARQRGIISAPLGRIVVDNGKSERITIMNNSQTMSSQHAITEYRVIESSSHGYTWVELFPLTGRKHQLRVHCAEVLGTPIVGDYKYGWQTHKKWKPLPSNVDRNAKGKKNPFGLDLESGSICEKQPNLHLHCKQMILPDVSLALEKVRVSSDNDYDLSEVKRLEFVAPLPSHMQTSWDVLKYYENEGT